MNEMRKLIQLIEESYVDTLKTNDEGYDEKDRPLFGTNGVLPEDGSTDIQYPNYEDNEGNIKEAFLAGYQEGHREGYNSYDRPHWGKDETPEEAYEYWIKHDRG